MEIERYILEMIDSEQYLKDPRIKELFSKLEPHKVEFDFCNRCDEKYGVSSLPAFTTNQGKIVICDYAKNMYPWIDTKIWIRHELIHLYDIRINNWDLENNIDQLIKSELRAYNYSGHCDWWLRFSTFDWFRSKETCLIEKATRSVRHLHDGELNVEVLNEQVKKLSENESF